MTFPRMKLCLYSFGIITLYEFVGCTSKPWKKTTLTSVTRFPGLAKLFRDTKFKNDPLKIEYDADIAIKRGICYYVFSSSYFKMIQKELVDPQLNETRRELNADYVDIYTEFYGTPRKVRESFFPYIKRRVYEYENEYKERPILVMSDETFDERVFTCLARDKNTGKIKEYFVSKEYNLNKANIVPWQKEYITGRFIFSYNSEMQLVVHALAEEAASFHTAYNNPESLYIARQRRVKLYKTMENDPICRMSDDDKLRTCTAIMSIPDVKKVFKFEPKMDNIESECVRRVLIFKSERIEQQLFRNGIVHREWTIACKAKRIEGWSEAKLYVSRTHDFNKVFVYNLTEDAKILINFIGSNIAVIDDDVISYT